MKQIERIYAILKVEGNAETICGFGNAPAMQAVSSKPELMNDALIYFRQNYPKDEFKLATFVRLGVEK